MKQSSTYCVATKMCIQVGEGMILMKNHPPAPLEILSAAGSVCDVMCRIGESGGDWGDPCWGDKWGHRECRGVGLGFQHRTNVSLYSMVC